MKSQYSPKITAQYTNPYNEQKSITLDIESKLQEFISFYQKTNICLPGNFEDSIREIWGKNQDQIQQSIEENGFDEVLVIPSTTDITELSQKMKMQNGYYDLIKTIRNVSDLSGIPLTSPNIDKLRIILVHKAQNIRNCPELTKTLNIQGKDLDKDRILSLEDYLIFSNKYFRETQKHLDEIYWTWLSTTSGALLVVADWIPDAGLLRVNAVSPGDRAEIIGAHLSRCFF